MNIIKPKRSNTVGFIPTTANLADGEFAINTADGVLFIRDGTVIKSFSFTPGAYGYDFDSADFVQNGTTTLPSSEVVPKISLVRNRWVVALAADVQLTTSNQWYDIISSASLPAGTYLVNVHITQWRTATTAENIFARITDGTTHYASTQAYHGSVANSGVVLHMTALITLTSAKVIKVQATSSAGAAASLIKAAMTANGSGNNATQMTIVRV